MTGKLVKGLGSRDDLDFSSLIKSPGSSVLEEENNFEFRLFYNILCTKKYNKSLLYGRKTKLTFFC